MNDYLKKGFKERRRHKMFVTKNTEYHLKDDTCVGVRKRDSGMWLKNSKALKARLIGSIENFSDVKIAKGGPPKIGGNLLFINEDGEDIITTSVKGIERPPKEAVQNYIPVEKKTLDDETSGQDF